jgi:hypothetical protein
MLLDKRCYGFFEQADVFGEKFFLGMCEGGVLEAKEVYFISDGLGGSRGRGKLISWGCRGFRFLAAATGELRWALGEERRQWREGVWRAPLRPMELRSCGTWWDRRRVRDAESSEDREGDGIWARESAMDCEHSEGQAHGICRSRETGGCGGVSAV